MGNERDILWAGLNHQNQGYAERIFDSTLGRVLVPYDRGTKIGRDIAFVNKFALVIVNPLLDPSNVEGIEVPEEVSLDYIRRVRSGGSPNRGTPLVVYSPLGAKDNFLQTYGDAGADFLYSLTREGESTERFMDFIKSCLPSK
tara:strand:+ start:280 stop:708 length:429 start_codon:yes stop_codon:yes gene_type:complete